MGKTKITIHRSEMSQELQKDALWVASLAYNMYKKKMNIAGYIKKEFQKKRGGSWNCVVGDCAFHVTYIRNGYINFSIGNTNIVLFRYR